MIKGRHLFTSESVTDHMLDDFSVEYDDDKPVRIDTGQCLHL